jgi:hypothetical protein
MLVPKTSMHEDNLPPSRENQVRRSRQGLLMKRVAVSEAVQESAHDKFWLGILSLDAAHDLAAACWRYFVHS